MGEQELMMDTAEGERLRRWRLVLGEEAQASCGLAGLSPEDRQMDEALAALYEADSRHSLRGGSGASSPRVARWLGDIRRFFPSSVVQVMQKDAFERLNLHSMLLQPEMLESVQPDVNLVSTLMSLRGIIPEKTKETARLVVRKVVDALMKQLEEPMRTAVSGALNRAVRNRRPRHAEIDWNRTIRANLKHWQQEYKTIVPETLIGYGRKSQRVQREIILCIDQSGSMASSVVYSSIFGAVMASMPAVKTHLVVFDTAVVDMTEQLDDPVDLLFGVQLGGEETRSAKPRRSSSRHRSSDAGSTFPVSSASSSMKRERPARCNAKTWAICCEVNTDFPFITDKDGACFTQVKNDMSFSVPWQQAFRTPDERNGNEMR